ncbi:MAG: amidophosphoribosyltransferase [Bacteroidota bacterium]|jgi:amidophosphoribosyltransferase
MSEQIKHECGIAMVRLLKPADYYLEKYGTPFYAQNKLYLLLEKQHNRGQDGAGVVSIKFDTEPGQRYISRYRSNENQPLKDIFGRIHSRYELVKKNNPQHLKDTVWLKNNLAFTGELFLGHLRYGTYGVNNIESCHPFLRQSNWKSKNLVVAGNFNLTNVEELFQQLVELGQHPKEKADTITIMERIGHFLDIENDKLVKKFKEQGFNNEQISPLIAEQLDIENILKEASKKWDGGYVMAGLIGHGDAFVLRDPKAIRPAFYYQDDEVVVVASERPTIQTAFNVQIENIKELGPGNALIIKKSNSISEVNINPSTEKISCSFERIYFSRGSDADIYKERKKLGFALTETILKELNYDLKNTVFSFIPNTAEVAFYGLVEGLENYLANKKFTAINSKNLSSEQLKEILSEKPRVEKLAIKDAKLRTFITDDLHRDEMVAHVYDVTYGCVNRGIDTLVVMDDSIVRGTTLKQSIIRILDRLGPKKIVIVSSAPQIRFPDCYGIDMAKMGDFIAFQAAIELLKKSGNTKLIEEIYHKCKVQINSTEEEILNASKEIYKPFTAEEISAQIASMIKSEDVKAEVSVIYQSLEGLHLAIPNHKGDWYFSGNYPTYGGTKVANQAFINYYEGNNIRAY